MHVTFRDRKHHRHIDASFTLFDGPIPTQQPWMVGDEVSFIFEITDEQKSAIEDFAWRESNIWENRVHLPCVVVKRRHCAAWKSVGRFDVVNSTSVTLEAISGDWEDILIWIITGRRVGTQPEEVKS
jgi:hypothetical protein